LNKLITIIGPTSSGKSDLAVDLALQFNGEIISADSRQVYTGLNIGTGKITPDEMKGVPHHLLDITNPNDQLTVALYKKQADNIIRNIHSRGALPFLVGGTGFYIQSVVYNTTLPEITINIDLRNNLATKTADELSSLLHNLDPNRHGTIDIKNPRRLIRAIEIATALGSVPKVQNNPQYNTLQIGIDISDTELKTRISSRLKKRLEDGMIEEAAALHKNGLSFKRMKELGLEYKFLALYLQKKLTKEELQTQLKTAIWQYAKRQRTWFKKDKNIHWFSLAQKKEVVSLLESFCSQV